MLERVQATVDVERAHVPVGTLPSMAAVSARGFPPLACALNPGRLAIECAAAPTVPDPPLSHPQPCAGVLYWLTL